ASPSGRPRLPRALLEIAVNLLPEAQQLLAAKLLAAQRRAAHRIGWPPVLQNLEMKMRSGGAACRTDEADHVALLDPGARRDPRREGGKMAIHRGDLGRRGSRRVLDLDPVAVAASQLGAQYDAVPGGTDRRAQPGREIDALVHRHRSAE